MPRNRFTKNCPDCNVLIRSESTYCRACANKRKILPHIARPSNPAAMTVPTHCPDGQPHHWLVSALDAKPPNYGVCVNCGSERQFPTEFPIDTRWRKSADELVLEEALA